MLACETRVHLCAMTSGRQNLYKQGGLISVTTRILIVDMLQKDMPVELITGLMVLHAERYAIFVP